MSAKYFRSLLVTGPRQVGKTTLLQTIAEPERLYVTLDNQNALSLATNDAEMFCASYPFPLLIDEVQRAPSLFLKLKEEIDKAQGKKNLLWLTGSQKIRFMKNLGDSLAGRVLIVEMHGLSQGEKHGDPARKPFLPFFDGPQTTAEGINTFLDEILAGSFPESYDQPPRERRHWFDSYIKTYMERDLPDAIDVKDQGAFRKFLRILALHTGQQINYSSIASEVRVSDQTIRTWITALEAYGLVYILKPYFANTGKRLVKTPKLYFMDTGLCAHLCGIRTREDLMNSRLAGAFIETYAISEIIKSWTNNLEEPRLCFYRDSDGHEIDLIIEDGGKLYPVEIKMSASPSVDMAKNFRYLPEDIRGMGAIVCLSKEKMIIRKDVIVMPLQLI